MEIDPTHNKLINYSEKFEIFKLEIVSETLLLNLTSLKPRFGTRKSYSWQISPQLQLSGKFELIPVSDSWNQDFWIAICSSSYSETLETRMKRIFLINRRNLLSSCPKLLDKNHLSEHYFQCFDIKSIRIATFDRIIIGKSLVHPISSSMFAKNTQIESVYSKNLDKEIYSHSKTSLIENFKNLYDFVFIKNQLCYLILKNSNPLQFTIVNAETGSNLYQISFGGFSGLKNAWIFYPDRHLFSLGGIFFWLKLSETNFQKRVEYYDPEYLYYFSKDVKMQISKHENSDRWFGLYSFFGTSSNSFTLPEEFNFISFLKGLEKFVVCFSKNGFYIIYKHLSHYQPINKN